MQLRICSIKAMTQPNPPNKIVPNSRLAPPAIPLNINEWKERSLEIMKSYNKEQIEKLYEIAEIIVKQANELMVNEHTTELVHKAQILFKPILYKTYHLYERENHTIFLSLISPEEWSIMQDKYIQSVRMRSDNAWELVEINISSRKENISGSLK